jgi:putative heme-binding domain-containing protein
MTIRNGISGSEMPPTRGPDQDIWRLVAFVKRLGSQGLNEKAPGDAAAGKAIYDRSGCSGCHTVNHQGGILGPDLNDVGRRRSLKFLEESLVKPEADLPLNYRGIRVTTAKGETVTGIRLNEDDTSIQLRTTGGDLRPFLKKDVKEIRRDSPSLMPAFGSPLSPKQLEDLVAYLSSLRGAR